MPKHRFRPSISRLLNLANRALRPADKFDYTVRKWVFGLPLEAQRSAFALSEVRTLATGPSTHLARRNNGLVSEVLAAIGRGLRAEYDLAQPIPERLARVLSELKQRESRRVLQSST
jgi:hypothetical protein